MITIPLTVSLTRYVYNKEQKAVPYQSYRYRTPYRCHVYQCYRD